MKKVFLLALMSTTLLYAQSYQDHSNGNTDDSHKAQAGGKVTWVDNFEQAMQSASKSNKPIILYFTGSDWCGWCKKMDQEVFSSPAFAEEVGHKFVFVKVDFPMNSKLPEAQARQNAQLKQRYGVTGYPTIVIVDSKGGFIGETGYRSGGGKAYAQWLEQFLGH